MNFESNKMHNKINYLYIYYLFRLQTWKISKAINIVQTDNTGYKRPLSALIAQDTSNGFVRVLWKLTDLRLLPNWMKTLKGILNVEKHLKCLARMKTGASISLSQW